MRVVLPFKLDGQTLVKQRGFPKSVADGSKDSVVIKVDGIPDDCIAKGYFKLSWENNTPYDLTFDGDELVVDEYIITLPAHANNKYIDYKFSFSVAIWEGDVERLTTNPVEIVVEKSNYSDETANTPDVPESQYERLLGDVITSIITDDELSFNSTNPVKNKVITEKINELATSRMPPVASAENDGHFARSNGRGWISVEGELLPVPTEEDEDKIPKVVDGNWVLVDDVVDTELDPNSYNPVANAAVTEALSDLNDEFKSDIDSIHETGMALRTEEYAYGEGGSVAKDFDLNGIAGEQYQFRVNALGNPNTNASEVYFMRADGTYQLAASNIAIGELYTATANADFVKIRFRFTYADYNGTAGITVSVSFNGQSFLLKKCGELSEEVDNLIEDVNTVKEKQNDLGDRLGDLEQDVSGKMWRDEVYVHGTQQSNPAIQDFEVDGVAGVVYSVRVNSMTYANPTIKTVYFIRSDGSYQTAVPVVEVGKLYEVTADADFVKIRFYFMYSPYPDNNIISVSFGYQTASLDDKMAELTERMDRLEQSGGVPVSILHGYTENVYCIGDSLTEGLVATGNGSYLSYYNYPYFLGKLLNTNVTAYAKSGDTASMAWDRWQEQIANIANSVVVVWLGTNPGSDVDKRLDSNVDQHCAGDDPDAWADNNTGDYGRIIKTLTDNGNKVVLAHIFTSHSPAIVASANAAIDALAERFNCKVIADVDELKEEKFHTAENGYYDITHFSCVGYSYVANVFYNKMNAIALADPQWFCIRKNKT